MTLKLKVHPSRIVATPAALAALEAVNVEPGDLAARTLRGDWGDVSPEDARANNAALWTGERVLAVYDLGGEKVWIIVDAALSLTRAVTTEGRTFAAGERYALTVLLPDDY